MPFDSMPVSEVRLIIEADTTSFPGYTVYGYAAPGTPTTAPRWLIFWIKNDSTINKRFANSSANFDQTWSTRAGITNWG